MADHPKKPAPAPAGCRITEVVGSRKARVIAKLFFDGATPRTIARDYGLSRTGVEHLIRVECRLKAARKAARA